MLSVAVAGLLLLASAALAEPPANDRFEDAEVLGPALPVQVTRSNVGAGKEEPGEPFFPFAAGHSVWFGWEAEDDRFITIDNCGSSFRTFLAVYTGPDLEHLDEIDRDYGSGTPACPAGQGSALTFEVKAGTTYWILVDGDGFYVEGPPPISEGNFALRIAVTPTPPNDLFDDATPLEGTVTEEPGGARFYNASMWGFSWNATKELGEPNHGGDPGGASVWYDWTAPASGSAEVGACESVDSLLGVYTGSTVGALTPVAGAVVPPLGSPMLVPCDLFFEASAGTTYRIAVDGKFDTGSGRPWMNGFWIHVAMRLPPKSSSGGEPIKQAPGDTTPPDTTITKRVLKRMPPIWILGFHSTEPDSTFHCKLDKHRFAKCPSSKRYEHVGPGSHTLKVFAVDPAGNADPSPAVAHFFVPAERKAHSRH